MEEISTQPRPKEKQLVCEICQQLTRHFLTLKEAVTYLRCDHCEATWMAPAHRLPPAEEKTIYTQHQNNLLDTGYRRFLEKLAKPLLAKLPIQQQGLDYGCGPTPLLAQMLTEAGHQVAYFDPFFHPDHSRLTPQYDFITASEVFEHLHRPCQVFSQLVSSLKPGGWLAIMTCFQTDDHCFSNWHYRRDPTHVVFYRETTLRYLAQQHQLSCEIPVKNVALMQAQT